MKAPAGTVKVQCSSSSGSSIKTVVIVSLGFSKPQRNCMFLVQTLMMPPGTFDDPSQIAVTKASQTTGGQGLFTEKHLCNNFVNPDSERPLTHKCCKVLYGSSAEGALRLHINDIFDSI